jgi:hypothetical protein
VRRVCWYRTVTVGILRGRMMSPHTEIRNLVSVCGFCGGGDLGYWYDAKVRHSRVMDTTCDIVMEDFDWQILHRRHHTADNAYVSVHTTYETEAKAEHTLFSFSRCRAGELHISHGWERTRTPPLGMLRCRYSRSASSANTHHNFALCWT